MWPSVLLLAFLKTDSGLHVTTQVATLEHGTIKMPGDTDGVIIEIGCSDRNTADNEILPYYPKGFLISFEPMLDKYAVLMARGTQRYHGSKRDKAVPLGHHHARGVVLPFAVATQAGNINLHVSSVAGCSSLLKVNKSTSWGRFCRHILENRTVDALGIEDVGALVPPTMPVHYMKLDMQGLDGTIIKSMPSAFLARVKKLQFESVNPTCNRLYDGQMLCPEIEAFLKAKGFKGKCGSGCEPVSTFSRP